MSSRDTETEAVYLLLLTIFSPMKHLAPIKVMIIAHLDS